MGRRNHTIVGITATQWAAALGDVSPNGLHRARMSLAGKRGVSPEELCAVADANKVPVEDLARALAERRGYKA